MSRFLAQATRVPHVWAVAVIGVGIALIFGAPSRTTSRSYDVAKVLTGGNVRLWGLMAITAGVLILIGLHQQRPRTRVAGYFIGAVWALFFSASFVISAVQDPRAALTGIPMYGGLGVALLLMGRAARRP
jgi:hypothetical protein